jgi:hypothetical protein
MPDESDSPQYDNIIDRFLAEYGKVAKKALQAVRAPETTVEEALDLQLRLSDLLDPLDLPDLDEEMRRLLAGKRIATVQDLSMECAEGLRLCPEFAATFEAPPEAFELAAYQDMSLGGFIKALQVIARGADTALLTCVGQAEEECAGLQQQMTARLQDPGTPREEQKLIAFAFAEPVRVREAALKKLAAPQGPAETEELKAEKLAQIKKAEDIKKLVHEFLKDAEAGTLPGNVRVITPNKPKRSP